MATVPVPRTWVASELVDATIMNGSTGVRDALSFILDPPRARAYQGTTGTTLVTAVGQVLLFDAEDSDNDSIHSTASNTSRMTFTTAGRYLIVASVVFPSNATGYRAVSIRKNAAGAFAGGTYLNSVTTPAVSGASQAIQCVWEDTFAATDYVECFGFQNSGGNLVTSLGVNQTSCTVRRVSA